MNDILFVRFDPLEDSIESVPNLPGNYIVTLRKGISLPDIGITPFFTMFQGMNVIYIGLAGTSLQDRDIKKHFKGNAGSSTLRKSIGCLFGYELIPRDSQFKKNKKTKFSKEDEILLSTWMTHNLLLFYYPNTDYISFEEKLIQKYNPPLNLDKNMNPINKEFRAKLSLLRNVVPCQDSNSIFVANTDSRVKRIGGIGLYVEIWEKMLPFILSAIEKREDSTIIGSDIFENVGKRKRSGYSFRLDISDAEVPIKKGSAVARDLKKVLDASLKFRELAKGHFITISMDKSCRLYVTVV